MQKLRAIEAKFEIGIKDPVETHILPDFSPLNYDYSKLSIKNGSVLYIAGLLDVSGQRYRQSKHPLDFSNVIVENFDCHGAANIVALPRAVINHLKLSGNKIFKISPFTQWPFMTKSIDISYTNVTDLSVFLIKSGMNVYPVLPIELQELVIDKKIKDNTSPDTLALFMDAYPNLTVTTKYIPLERLNSNDKNIIIKNGNEIIREINNKSTPKRPPQELPIIHRIPVKDSLYEMDLLDIKNILAEDEEIKNLKISKTELDRYIRTAIANINKFNRIRPDLKDEIVSVCISRADFDKENIKASIVKQVQMTKELKAQKIRDKVQASADHLSRQKNKQTKIETKDETKGKKEPNTYSIKKYISQTIWKQIKTECGNDVARQKQTLENIQRLNIPTWNIKDGPIPFVDDNGNITHSQTTRKHGFRCIAQSLGSDSQRSAPRILWTCSDDGLFCVATAFFSDHNKARMQYRQAIRAAQDGRDINNIQIDFETIQSKQNLYDVDDLLKTEFGSIIPISELIPSIKNEITK